MSEARRRKLLQFGCDPFSPRPSGLGRRSYSYSLQDLKLAASPSASPCRKNISDSFKSSVFQPVCAGAATVKPNPYRPQDVPKDKVFYNKLSTELLPTQNHQPKEILDIASQFKSNDLYLNGQTHSRAKSLEQWIPSNIGTSQITAQTKANDFTVQQKRETQKSSNVFPLHSRSKTPDVCSLYKWNDSRGEVRRRPVEMTARQRKSIERLSSVFGEQALHKPNIQLLIPTSTEPIPKSPPVTIRQKPIEPPTLPMKRNVKAQKSMQRNCVPLTPKQMREVMLRSPVVDCTPSKLLTLDLRGLSSREDDFTIKQACQGFHVVSVRTKNDQIKGTCQGSARIQLRVHDDTDSVKRLGIKLSERGWDFSEPGSLGKKCKYIETSKCNFLDSNVEKEQCKAFVRNATYSTENALVAPVKQVPSTFPLTEHNTKLHTQVRTWEQRRSSTSPVAKMHPLNTVTHSSKQLH